MIVVKITKAEAREKTIAALDTLAAAQHLKGQKDSNLCAMQYEISQLEAAIGMAKNDVEIYTRILLKGYDE